MVTKQQAPLRRLSEGELLNVVALRPQDVRAWALSEGYANLQQHIDGAAVIAAQAASTVTLLLAGIGGALAFAVRVVEPGAGPVAWGAAAVCGYLALLVALLLHTNIRLDEVPMLHNQPESLLAPNATLEQLHMGELVNLEMRIRTQAAINNQRARALNWVRGLAAACPLVFVVAGLVARYA